LHRAAIEVLGIDATYDAFEVDESTFPGFLGGLDESFGGLSLTMPLKHAAQQFLTSLCPVSVLTGSVNTMVRMPDGWHGFNTDVWGATQAIERSLGSSFSSATLLGAGATAASLVVAAHDLGVERLELVARDVGRAEFVSKLARELGLTVRIVPFGESTESTELLLSSLPNTVELSPEQLDALDAGCLFDVVYSPWPSALAQEWESRGLPVANGLSMLLMQAVRQARVFYGDGIDDELPNEALVVTAMRATVGL
jgi:shikimate dehydrogenase